jgi:hypothetical protein
MFPSKFPGQQKEAKEQIENHKDETESLAKYEKLEKRGKKRFYKNIIND